MVTTACKSRVASLTFLAPTHFILYIGTLHAESKHLAQEFREDEEVKLQDFLKRSVTVGTAKSYASGIEKWKGYLQTLPSDSYPGIYLEILDDDESKAKRVVLYMAFLYLEKGLRGEQVQKAIACLTYHFEVTGRSSKFLQMAVVNSYRKDRRRI